MSEVIPVIRDHYENISDDREHIRILYRSDLDQEHFESDFRNQLRRDLVTGRTNMGIHRDEYVFDIDGFSLKKFGSQGQQKSMVIALKLAQFDLLRKKNGFKPLLLLDDIFDKLDEKRMSKIMSMVAGHAFGQIFVTDAHFGRIREVFRDIDSKQVVYNIVNGKPVRSEK